MSTETSAKEGHRSADDAPRVLFYVQHLLGIGHLLRAARVVKALSGDGFNVLLALGGTPTPGLDVGNARLLQLPPVKAGPAGFSALVHPDGRAFDKDDEAKRTRELLGAFDKFAPDALVVEAFPFGRRQMRFELLPLIERARKQANPVLIAASVRDILQRSRRADRAAETVAIIREAFDLVLVHGDPRLTVLGDTFPGANSFAEKVIYTGIVAPEPPSEAAGGPAYDVIVSAGGGAVGLPLLEGAVLARPLTRMAGRPWLVLTGPNLPPEAQTALAREGSSGLEIKRFVPGLANLLTRADVSVSQAGYNTVADILRARCRAVFVPFAQDGETEQTDRADLLTRGGAFVTVREPDLTPERLAAAIDAVMEHPRPSPAFDLDGASATARILRQKLHGA